MRPYLKILSAGYDMAQLAEPLPCMRKTIVNSRNCTKKNKYKKSQGEKEEESQGQDLGTQLLQPRFVVSSVSQEAARTCKTSVSGL